MGRSDIQLIPSEQPPARARALGAVALALLLVGTGLVATLRGADQARVRSDPREDARRLVEETFERGSRDASLRAEFAVLRHRVARLPLDASARSAYAIALTVLSGSHDGLEAAAFHARTAARCAPVTVPVVRRSAIVLAQTGNTVEATHLTRQMFEYDPPAAARLLATLEPFLASTAVREAVPDRPEARLARIRQLQRVGRKEEANVGLDQALERWPEELAIRGMAAERAYVDRNWRELARLLPTDEVYPDTFDSAPLYIYRSRTRASADDADGARADLDRAVELGGHRPWILNMVGDAWLEMERPELARGIWTRAMHASASESAELRAASTRRLARLAETQGQAGTALRLWRDVIELIPEDEEASRRIARLEIDR